MCGIIGVISRRPTRSVPTDAEIVDLLDRAVAAIADVPAVTELLGDVDVLLHGLPGLIALVDRPQLVAAITARLDQLDAFAAEVERRLETDDLAADELERRGAESIAMRDALWAVR